MTVSESIIEWLKTFDPEEYWKMKQVDTDIQSAKVDSYSLVKEPVRNEKTYVTGRKVITDHYMLRARLSSQENTDCVENNGFGEALEDWVSEQNRIKNFPRIPDATVQHIGVTTPFYMGKTATDNSIYQLTVAIKYEKKEKELERELQDIESQKEEIVYHLVSWAKKGGAIRRMLGLAAIFFFLAYYHSIGKSVTVEWREVYKCPR